MTKGGQNKIPKWPKRTCQKQQYQLLHGGNADGPQSHFVRNERVLHREWGLGRVIHVSTVTAAVDDTVTVEFQNGARNVGGRSLRKLLPVTVLAHILENAGTEVKSWAVRKANDAGAIRPDVVGHCAGHRVHYYDVSRIPELLRLLSQPDPWSVGTLIIHAGYGPGMITGYAPEIGDRQRSSCSARVVAFFNRSALISVCIQELRRLLPSHAISRHLGAQRRMFSRRAGLYGIHPDYIAPHGRIRSFYDESRIEEIRHMWSAAERAIGLVRGSVVVDAHGEMARVETRDVHGQAQIRDLQLRAPRRAADIAGLRGLVSLRELARREHMSRYKLNRLLTASGVRPLCQHGQAFYFDPAIAHEAVRQQLDRERKALTLPALASRTGISEAVLSKKVRAGVIRTLENEAAHRIEATETERIEKVIRANQSDSESLQRWGICGVHRRGRAASEVTSWNIERLLDTARCLSSDRQEILFGQVSWLCEGAGEKRFRQALDAYLVLLADVNERQRQQCAELLLQLIGYLPGQRTRYGIRLSLLASTVEVYLCFERRLRQIAAMSGCHHKHSFERFRAHVDQHLTDLVTEGAAYVAGRPYTSAKPSQCGNEEFIPGAIVTWGRDRIPCTGTVVRIEQQCWDPMTRAVRQTMLVRFPDGERLICTDPRLRVSNDQPLIEPAHVLLRAAEVEAIAALMRTGSTSGGTAPHQWAGRMAS